MLKDDNEDMYICFVGGGGGGRGMNGLGIQINKHVDRVLAVKATVANELHHRTQTTQSSAAERAISYSSSSICIVLLEV